VLALTAFKPYNISMRSLLEKIPERYYPDFLEEQTNRLKKRIRLAICFFPPSFLAGTSIATLLVLGAIPRTLAVTWALSLAVCGIIFLMIGKADTLRKVKTWGVVFSALLLVLISQYQIALKISPFETIAVYLIMLFGLVITVPWFKHEVLGISFLHMAAFSSYFFNISLFSGMRPDPAGPASDYVRGMVMLSIVTFICFIVTKREREKEVENFGLLKEVEEKNRQMQSELELANRVHARLIPKSARTRLADIATTYLPVHYMGGDYAKFKLIDDSRLLFIICDVTGHGVPAALLVNSLHTEFERLSRLEPHPGRLLKKLDEFISEDFMETNMFLTAFCGLLDYEKMRFTYSNYGHLPQYCFRITGADIEHLPSQTTMIGIEHAFQMSSDSTYEKAIPFSPGDRILLFTDGITEARDLHNEEYGPERLEDFIKENAELEVEDFNNSLIEAVRDFSGRPFHDDIFILNIHSKSIG
jgi:serine phosphatase RsbU (regulator of sigma subunit)